MTNVDMQRAARAIVPPAGATKAIATYDQGAYRAAFLIDDRRHGAPVGPSFGKPREVCSFVDLLNGDGPTPRPAPDPDLTRAPGDTASRVADPVSPEAPDDEAIPGTPGIEPATTRDPAHGAVVGASPVPSAVPPAAPGTEPRPAAPA